MATPAEAKKRFGQHFLKDPYIVRKIIEAMPDGDEVVVEVGPGLGDLTQELLRKKPTVAIEIDDDMSRHLKKRFASELKEKRLSLIEEDVLSVWDRRTNLVDGPYHLIANLPYNVGTEIILRALRDPLCKEMVVMVQKEVAEKFTASVGEKAYSGLAILTATVGEGSYLLDVPAEAFDPPPKVESAVFRIRKEKETLDENFARFLKMAFTQPRKTLAKNLSRCYSREVLDTAWADLELSGTVRPHEVTVRQFSRLFSLLENKGSSNGQPREEREDTVPLR